MAEDGFNFVIYKRKEMLAEDFKKVEHVKLIDVIKQLQVTGDIESKSDHIVIVRGTTNFDAAKIKKAIGQFYTVESFLQDHPFVNGISNKPNRAY